MKILVLGHSDSDGSQLDDAADSWPRILERELAESLATEVTVVHRTLFAGPTAVGFLERLLEAERPDAVILATSSFGSVFRFVSVRAREVLGERAGAFVERIEVGARGLSHSDAGLRRRVAEYPRRAVRRALGAKAAASPAALLESYSEVMRRLAREEDVHVTIAGGVGFSRFHERMNPGMRGATQMFAARLEEMALRHQFDWVSHEEVLGGRTLKEAFYLPDGVHTTEAAQRMLADAIRPLIERWWRMR